MSVWMAVRRITAALSHTEVDIQKPAAFGDELEHATAKGTKISGLHYRVDKAAKKIY